MQLFLFLFATMVRAFWEKQICLVNRSNGSGDHDADADDDDDDDDNKHPHDVNEPNHSNKKKQQA